MGVGLLILIVAGITMTMIIRNNQGEGELNDVVELVFSFIIGIVVIGSIGFALKAIFWD